MPGTYKGLALQGGSGTGAAIDIVIAETTHYELTPHGIADCQGKAAGTSEDWYQGQFGGAEMIPESPGWGFTIITATPSYRDADHQQ